MRRLGSLGGLAFATILLGLFTLNGNLLALSIPALLFSLTSLFYSPGEAKIRVERSLSRDRAAIFADIEVEIRITNEGDWLEEVEISGLIPKSLEIIAGKREVIVSLKQGESLNLDCIVRGARGEHIFPEVVVRSREHFGLLSNRTSVSAPVRLLVIPRALPLKRVVIRPPRTRGYAGQIPTRLGGVGVDFYGIRSYEPGDSLQRIDWKTSARHYDTFFTKLFDQERVADVSLILDSRQRTNMTGNGNSLFEYSIQATAALAETFLAAGNRVSMLIYGDLLDWTYPGYGKIQGERILQKLAKAKLGASTAFNKLNNMPTGLLPPNAQLVFVGPLAEDDVEMLQSMPARGFTLLVISPDPVEYAAQQLPPSENLNYALRIARIERTLTIRSLRETGIQVVEWRVDVPFEQVAGANLTRPPAWLRTIGVAT